jgi:hypothetical protein
MQSTFKKYLPHLVAVVLFAVLTLIYFKPLLSGKEISQHDIMQARGMSKEIVDFREKEHSEPLWTNSMFSGMPAYQISTLYPGNWIYKLNQVLITFLPHPGSYIFLCFLGFFILLLCLKVEPWLALIGSIAYGFSTYFIVALGAGHNSKINALAYLPPLIGGLVLLFRGKLWLGFAVSALFMALELTSNHVQITYYGFMIIGAVILGYAYYAFKEKTLPSYFKALALFVVACIISVLPNAGNLMCTEEYSKYSTRGPSELTITPDGKSNAENKTSGLDKDYVTQYSHGISESFTFLIPDYKGGSSSIPIGEEDPDALRKVGPDFKQAVGGHGSYFGDQYITAGPVYIGAIIMFLVILGLFITKNKLKWPLLLITLLGMALSWGSHFMGLTSFFLDHVPGYNKFRAVSMTMVIAELCLPLFAILTLNELIRFKSLNEKVTIGFIKKQIELKKILIIAFVLVGGFCLVGYLAPGLVNSFTADGEEQQMIYRYMQGGNPEDQVRSYVTQLIPQLEIARKAVFQSDAMRSFIFITLAFVFIYLYLNKKLKREMLFAALGIFILVDLWTVDMRYLGEKNFVTKSQNMASFEKTPADEEILKDTDPNYRVLNVAASPFQDAATSYLHKSIGGYHGAKLKKYQELYDFYYQRQMNTFYGGIRTTAGNDTLINELFSKLGIFNMLNTKYLIIPIGEEGRTAPLRNPQANGNAWFVKEISLAENADQEITGLGKIDTKTQAIMQAKFKSDVKVDPNYTGQGNIKLVSYKANDLVYESESNETQFAVFSEIYYPKGWNAYLDGTIVPHVPVDYVLRGMPVPAGKHKIEFKFEPQTYKTGNSIAMVGSILVLISVAGGLFLGFKKDKTVA